MENAVGGPHLSSQPTTGGVRSFKNQQLRLFISGVALIKGGEEAFCEVQRCSGRPGF